MKFTVQFLGKPCNFFFFFLPVSVRANLSLETPLLGFINIVFAYISHPVDCKRLVPAGMLREPVKKKEGRESPPPAPLPATARGARNSVSWQSQGAVNHHSPAV